MGMNFMDTKCFVDIKKSVPCTAETRFLTPMGFWFQKDLHIAYSHLPLSRVEKHDIELQALVNSVRKILWVPPVDTVCGTG